jgi:hypothetical protein
MAAHLTRNDSEGFPVQCSRTVDDVLWNGSEVDGIVRSECEEHESTNCEDGDSDTDW